MELDKDNKFKIVRNDENVKKVDVSRLKNGQIDERKPEDIMADKNKIDTTEEYYRLYN